MPRSLMRFLYVVIAAFATLTSSTTPSLADSFAGVAGTWNWTNAGAWAGGVPALGTPTSIGHTGGGPVAGVNMQITGSTDAGAGYVLMFSDSSLLVEAGSSLTLGNHFAPNFNSNDDSRLNLYGEITVESQVLFNGDEYNFYNGSTFRTTFGGAFRLAQGDGSVTVWNIHPGSTFNFSGVDIKTSESNTTGSATVNQTGGLAFLSVGALVLNASGGATTNWNLSGGELAIGGSLTKAGGSGAINVVGGKLYLVGDHTADLTHSGSIAGATSATYGDWFISNGVQLRGYTLFEGVSVPEPSSFVLMVLGLVGLTRWGIRHRQKG